ncbi:MAG: hypothetical protein P0Y53_19305 [Candidatus Pseudobacter hemicellulosilyticus]|uniref:Uncharacterized protein n=1 Tax=Candidatus Pseudobacter hemicellulosilyticus TaxID=3121375 RepID=A0AAJ6BGC7_9BACT|nr:MAG: hypothetical protein P0Y53_19305 [Pseudobacter sp.]
MEIISSTVDVQAGLAFHNNPFQRSAKIGILFNAILFEEYASGYIDEREKQISKTGIIPFIVLSTILYILSTLIGLRILDK